MQKNKEKNTNLYYKSASLALLSVLFLLLAFSTEIPIVQLSHNTDNIQHILPEDPFLEITVNAEAAFVYQPGTGRVLFSKNENAQLPLASITKIMSAIVAAGLSGPEQIVRIPSSAIKTAGDSGLFANEKWKILDLLNFTLMVSSNDGASALASVGASVDGIEKKNTEVSFIDKMNKKSKDLGLKQTYFLNASGLDLSDSQSGAYGSARDVAHMFAYAVEKIPIALEATNKTELWFESESGFKHSAINTNKAISEIPGFIAGKTGYTDLAGGNLVIEYDTFGEPTVAVVLGSTKEGRFEDIIKLVKASTD